MTYLVLYIFIYNIKSHSLKIVIKMADKTGFSCGGSSEIVCAQSHLSY